jgi:hypothetical protein
LEQQGQVFLDKTKRKGGHQWAQEQIMMYIDSLKKRVSKHNTTNERNEGEIAAGTVKNFIQPIKLFYKAHDLPLINWEWIFKALPRARSASNDRAPTREEIHKVIQANDRRVKPIVLTMCSSVAGGACSTSNEHENIPFARYRRSTNLSHHIKVEVAKWPV